MAQPVQSVDAQIEQFSDQIQMEMEQKARMTGSKPMQHIAEGLKAHHNLMVDKQLVERFNRIKEQLELVRQQSPQEFDRTQRQTESLRPLLRLSLRSVGFREMMISFLRILKHIWEENVEGPADVEKILKKGEHDSEAAKEEAKSQGEQVWRDVREKMEGNKPLINDNDWEKIKDQLDKIFKEIRQHPEYQRAVNQLFELPTVLRMDIEKNNPETATERVKEESKDLIAQFSGREVLDRLFEQLEDLRVDLKENEEAQTWWKEFKDILERTTKGYADQTDLDRLRVQFDRSSDIFDKFRPQLNDIIDTITQIFENMSNDEYVKDLQERLSIIMDDLYRMDAEGNKSLNTEMTREVTAAIGGILLDHFRSISVPDIRGSGNGVDYSLHNLNVYASLPDVMQMHLESDVVIGIPSERFSETRTRPEFRSELHLVVSMRGIELRADSVAFTYNSTMLTESGLMDVRIPSADLSIFFVYSPFIPSSGAGFTTKIEDPIRHRYQFLRVKTYFIISNLEIEFNKASLKHNILSPALVGLYKSYLTHKFESEIQDALNEKLKEVGQQITSFLEQNPDTMSLAGYVKQMAGFGME
jgi:hypothetical protein